MELGEFLKKRRKELGLSGEFVANKLGVHKTNYHKWENGQVEKIAYKHIEPLSNLLQIPPMTILRWENKKESSFIELPYYDWAASAGKGNYLLDEGHDFEYKEFENVPENASFALRIKGDSMLPKFTDNDIVFVRTHVVVEYGQIGVFILNNESYLKQWRDGKLVSLNPKYEPIKIKEFDEFHCVGRVLGKASENDK